MSQLPDAIMRAWENDSFANGAGLMEMAGVDAHEVFRSRSIKEHPWIGLEVQFPFPEIGKGKIVNCIIYPKGNLMFDVFFEEPCPPILGYSGHFYVAKSCHPEQYHRFFANELRELATTSE